MVENYRGQRHSHPDGIAGTLPPIQSSMLEVEFAQISDTGPIRPNNEDYVGYVLPEMPGQARTHGWLFALADGVGGHAQGEVASQVAVESVLAGFRGASREEPLSALLQRLVRLANARIFEVALAAGKEGAGMATTIVSCALRHDRAVVAHVGDSRCYLTRQGEIRLLTRDHTVANEHARLGLLSEQEAEETSSRHVLNRSLGTDLSVNVEINDYQVIPGDVLLLCSDGLHGALSANQIAHAIVHGPDLEATAQTLVKFANEQDGADNVSAQLIRVRSVERVGMYRGRPYKLR